METYKIIFSLLAREDLDNILQYIAQDDPEAAQYFGEELIEKAWSLEKPLVRNLGKCLPGRPKIRRLVHGEYLIIYRILESRETVIVLRFWHGAQDWRKIKGLK